MIESQFEHDLRVHLNSYRVLSTWGADFKDPVLFQGWKRKLEPFPMECIIKALDQLSGKKEFPHLADVVLLTKKALGDKKFEDKLPKEKPKDSFLKTLRFILRSPMIQSLKEKSLGEFYSLQHFLLYRIGLSQEFKDEFVDFDRLKIYENDISSLIEDYKKFIKSPEHFKESIRTLSRKLIE